MLAGRKIVFEICNCYLQEKWRGIRYNVNEKNWKKTDIHSLQTQEKKGGIVLYNSEKGLLLEMQEKKNILS